MELATLAEGFEALEGPTVGDGGELYVCDLKAGVVYRITVDGDVSVVVSGRERAGGLCLHHRGGLVVSGPDLVHVLDGETRVVLDLEDVGERLGARAVGFNDLHPDARGRVLVGVLRRGDDGESVPGEVLLVTAEHEFVVVDDDVHANGLAFAHDGRQLFYVDTFRRRVMVADVRSDDIVPVGDFSTAEIDGLPDGLATDVDGGIWVAFYKGSCVVRFLPTGEVDRVVPVPARKALSVCFSGLHRTDLVVVTGRSVDEPGRTAAVLVGDVGVKGTIVGRASI
jgi:sugar lactone lactonase YvrE